jgi:hypothetical protein
MKDFMETHSLFPHDGVMLHATACADIPLLSHGKDVGRRSLRQTYVFPFGRMMPAYNNDSIKCLIKPNAVRRQDSRVGLH